ncbi:MAG TPA: hypothetical protein VKT77_19595 [Chthonomonadaceae bacterium]|nr:hypothetical protein [Chthonomonadaceae bacterium]
MRLPAGAKLPIAVALAMGLCVGAAALYAVNGLLALHAAGWQIAFAALFASAELATFAWGFALSGQALARLAREAAAIPEATSKLAELAGEVERRIDDGATAGPRPLTAETPMLDARLAQTWRSLRRGRPLPSAGTPSDAPMRDGPEREIDLVCDVTLAIGMAGAFVTVLMAVGVAAGQPAGTLFSGAAPGLTLGLSALIARLSLRMCRRAVGEEHARVAARADDAIAEGFVAHLPKALASPQDRLALASEELAQDTREILEYSFEKHNASLQKILAAQSAQSDTLLRQHALLIGEVLKTQVQQPIQQLANAGDALARQTAAVAAAAGEIRSANAEIVAGHRAAQEEQTAATTEMLAQHRAALNDFLEVLRQANHVVLVEMQEASGRQLQEHAAAAAQHLATFQERFATLIAEYEGSQRRLTEAALGSLAGAVEGRVATVDARFAATLARLEAQLPDHLRGGLREAMGETVAVLTALREQAALLAQSIAQVSANADRQLLTYERWQDRAAAAQARLEELLAAK